ncbi:hypothetical protein ACOSQ2_012897 [Xanthoceras sorbifolium]
MAIGSSRLFFFLFCALVHLTTLTVAQPNFLYHYCSDQLGNYTTNSTYQKNLNTLLSSITSNSEINYGFYNFSAGQNSDKVNAIALCRGDVNLDACRSCINDSVSELTQSCPNQKEAIGQYDKCMLRYSNRTIFGVKETSRSFYMWNTQNVSSVDQFNQVLTTLLASLRSRAASGSSLRKFATGNATAPDFKTLYALVQCTPDLSKEECSDCLIELTADDELTPLSPPPLLAPPPPPNINTTITEGTNTSGSENPRRKLKPLKLLMKLEMWSPCNTISIPSELQQITFLTQTSLEEEDLVLFTREHFPMDKI